MKVLEKDFSKLRWDFAETNWKKLLTGIIVLGLVLRAAAYLLDPIQDRDACYYLGILNSWLQRGSWQAITLDYPELWIPPFYCALTKLLSATGLSLEHSGVLISIFSGTFMILWAYLIGKKLFKDWTLALAGALLTATHPMLIDLSIKLLRDSLYLALATAVLYLFLEYLDKQKIRPILISGIIGGIAMATRIEAIELNCILAIILFIQLLRKDICWKKAVLFMLAFAAVFALSFILINLVFGTEYYLTMFGSRLRIYLNNFTFILKGFK